MADRAWQGIRSLMRRVRHPDVIVDPPPNGVERRPDIPVTLADGTVLRVDVYLPRPGSRGAAAHLARRPRSGEAQPGRYPVVMCAHPYGKDEIPAESPSGREASPQYRVFRQPEPIRFSAWTGWEAPDPAYWCRRGFAVVNADLRGFGRSEGVGDLLSEQEAADYEELIGWAADQPWSNGRVGLLGVSYLALSQYRVAARRPRGLVAICPWEGFSDVYRDFARPGGGREDGFMVMWSAMVEHTGRVAESMRSGQKEHPLLDGFWRARIPDLTRIQVPMLVCGSFSDHLLHSRGSHEAFRRAGSRQKWLYTHRGGKWCTFYSPEALATQLQFLTEFVADVDTGWADRHPVRLAIHRDRKDSRVVATTSYPPPGTRRRAVRLGAGAVSGGTGGPDPSQPRVLDTKARGPAGTVSVAWRVDTPLAVVGTPWLALPVSLPTGGDALLFAALRLFRDGTEVTFEGSYGFPDDVVTHGQLRLSHRDLDPDLSDDLQPVHRHDRSQPLAPDEVVTVRLPMLPQATDLSPGDVLRLDLSGRWFFPTSPADGPFPARYESSPAARIRLHLTEAVLHLPVWDEETPRASPYRPRAAR